MVKETHGERAFQAAFRGSGNGFKVVVERSFRGGGVFASGPWGVGAGVGHALY
jgi:hypothetical protein